MLSCLFSCWNIFNPKIFEINIFWPKSNLTFYLKAYSLVLKWFKNEELRVIFLFSMHSFEYGLLGSTIAFSTHFLCSLSAKLPEAGAGSTSSGDDDLGLWLTEFFFVVDGSWLTLFSIVWWNSFVFSLLISFFTLIKSILFGAYKLQYLLSNMKICSEWATGFLVKMEIVILK